MLKINNSNKYYNPRTNKHYIIMALSEENDNSPILTDDINVINYLLSNSILSEIPISSNEFSKYLQCKLETIDEFATEYIHPKFHTFDEIKETLDIKKYTLIEKDKLNNIENNANNYKHPDNHSINDIIPTSEKQFLTAEEKLKLQLIENNANNYKHPNKHSADIIEETIMRNFVTKVERENWNNKPSLQDVSNNIKEIINFSPDALKVCNEIQNLPEYKDVIEKLLAKINSKLDKVDNKQLSDENFTSEEKLKLQLIENNAINYKHPISHHASMIDDLDSTIISNNIIATINNKKHDQLHRLDDPVNHLGILHSKENNIPIFTDDGFIKDSNKYLPTSNIIGESDEQVLMNKSIDNSSVGLNFPSVGNFTKLYSVPNTISLNGNIYLGQNDLKGNILFINGDSTIYLPNTNQIMDGSNTTIIILVNSIVELICDYYNRIIINNDTLKFGTKLTCNQNNIGSFIKLLKTSNDGWISLDIKGNWTNDNS